MFVLIKSKCVAIGEVRWEWAVVTSLYSNAREVSKKCAERIIRDYHLVLAHSDDDGLIYEEPGCPFREKHRGSGRKSYDWRVDEKVSYQHGYTDERAMDYVARHRYSPDNQ